jgi:hypothetical protein
MALDFSKYINHTPYPVKKDFIKLFVYSGDEMLGKFEIGDDEGIEALRKTSNMNLIIHQRLDYEQLARAQREVEDQEIQNEAMFISDAFRELNILDSTFARKLYQVAINMTELKDGRAKIFQNLKTLQPLIHAAQLEFGVDSQTQWRN